MIRVIQFYLALCVCILLQGCQPTQEPETPKGMLRISTSPMDMPIFVDGALKGNSPSGEGQYFSISLEEGEYEVTIFKEVNAETELFAKKTLFIAADTFPILNLKAETRFTAIGKAVEEKRLKSEAEKKKKADEIRRKRAAIGKISWSKTFGGVEYEKATGVKVDNQGNIWIAGYTSSYGNGSGDYYLVKTNRNGEEIFSKTFGSQAREEASDLALTANGGVVLLGEKNNRRGPDFYFVKVSEQGEKVWEKSVGGNKGDLPRALALLENQTYVAVGYSDDGYNGYIVSVDDKGDLAWDKKIKDCYFQSVIPSNDKKVIVGGKCNDLTTLIKLDYTGQIIWRKTYGSKDFNSFAYSLSEDAQGNVFIGGNQRGANGKGFKIRKVSPTGDLFWEKDIGNTENDYLKVIKSLPDGGALIGAEISPIPNGEKYHTDINIVRVDQSGKQIWQRSFGRSKNENIFDLSLVGGNGAIVVGSTSSRGAGSEDMYVVKMENVISTGISK